MIRVLVVTPVRLLSDLIQVACKNRPDLAVIGCVKEKAEALPYRDQCDVMLVSHAVPDILSLVQTFGPHSTGPAVLVMGLPNIEPLILRYLEAGAAGCIREQDSSEELVRAIRLAAARQVALTADLFPLVLKRVSTLSHQQRDWNAANEAEGEKSLTRREREILQLLAQGCGNREIAQQLTIELGTTKNHVHNILDKLNVKTRRDAAVYFALGLV
jgi:two-component system, NarL family, nitrate/nitrite response regulator NarL